MHAPSIPRPGRSRRTLSVLLAASAALCFSLLVAASYTLYTVLRYKDLERDALLVLTRWQTMDALANDVLLKRVSLSDGGASETLAAWERETLDFSLALARFNDDRRLAPLGSSIVSDVDGAVGLWLLAQNGVLEAQRSLRSMIRSGLASRVMVNGFLQTSYLMRGAGQLAESEVVAIQDLVSALAVLDTTSDQFDQRLRAVVSRISRESGDRIGRVAALSLLFALAFAALSVSSVLALRNYRSAERRRRSQADRLRRDFLRVLFESPDGAEVREAEASLREMGAAAVFASSQVLCLFRFDGAERPAPAAEDLVPFLDGAGPGWERFLLDDEVTAALLDGAGGSEAACRFARAVQAASLGAGRSLSFAVSDPFGPGADRRSTLRALEALFAYRYARGPGAALYAGTPPAAPSAEFEYPTKTEELCVKRLLEGNAEEAGRYLESVIDQARPYPPAVIRAVVARLSSALFAAVERIERAGGFALPSASVGRLAEIVLLDNVDGAVRRFRSLLSEIDRLQRSGDGEGRLRELAERTDRLIDSSYADPDLSLDRLADRLGLSSGYLGRVYRKAAGKSVADAITERRLSAAETALAAGDWTVEAVAAGVGIANPGSFYRLFKGRYGLTPAEYRERSRGVLDQASS